MCAYLLVANAAVVLYPISTELDETVHSYSNIKLQNLLKLSHEFDIWSFEIHYKKMAEVQLQQKMQQIYDRIELFRCQTLHVLVSGFYLLIGILSMSTTT